MVLRRWVQRDSEELRLRKIARKWGKTRLRSGQPFDNGSQTFWGCGWKVGTHDDRPVYMLSCGRIYQSARDLTPWRRRRKLTAIDSLTII